MQDFVTETLELHQKLFDEMLVRFNLSAKEISETAKISEVTLSRFRRGRTDLGTGKFLAVVAALPKDAREWYILQLLGEKPTTDLRSLVTHASLEKRIEVLRLIVDLFATSNRKALDTSEFTQVG